MHPMLAGGVRFARIGTEAVLVLAAIAVLRRADAVADVPFWTFAVVLCLGVLHRSVTTARRLGDLAARGDRAEAAAALAGERLEVLLRDGAEVITTAAATGDVTWVSPSALPVMGYRPAELHGPALGGLVHPDDRQAATDLISRVAAATATVPHSAELRVRHADGTWHWHEVVARNLLADPAVRAVVSHRRDITERRAAEHRIAYSASHDALTGLANGPTLARDLARALTAGTRYQHPVVMLICDLDGFRAVIDTYGRDVGDRLLQIVGGVLRRVTRDTDTAGRLGGDEFGVVLTRVNTVDEALSVARRIIDGVTANATVAGMSLDVGCRVGVALAPPGGSDADTLMRHADAALDRAKRRGRNIAQIYVEEEVTAPWS
ncbi:diguanylate cyclase domain-containing protein [Actinoplanes sp. NPDC049599]|uniref:diguanylate cyclase domain-containing protein n=1 Tax=Actinoplanes sp. NPDC049599 TaxID=3363903 RepID=UPI0037AC84B9